MRNTKHLFTCFLLLLSMPAFAIFRENVLFSVQLDGAQMVPISNSNARGLGSVMLNKKRDSITIHLNLLDLAPGSAGVYVGLPGANGSLLFDLSDGVFGRTIVKRFGGTLVKNNIAQLMTNGLYIVVGSPGSPNGEIRGQIKLITDDLFKGDLKGSEVVPAQTNAAFGLSSLGLSLDRGAAHLKYIVQQLSGPITHASLHKGAMGATGPELLDLTPQIDGNVLSMQFTPSTELVNALLAGEVYLNLSTSAAPNGELRTQMRHQSGFVMETFSTGAQMTPPVSSEARSLGVFRFSPAMDSLYYDIVLDKVMTNIDYMHLHIGYIGQPYTALQVGLTPSVVGNRVQGVFKGSGLSATTISKLLIGNLTLITHTAAHPDGEIRGHVMRYPHRVIHQFLPIAVPWHVGSHTANTATDRRAEPSIRVVFRNVLRQGRKNCSSY
jgi:hypothetical protein